MEISLQLIEDAATTRDANAAEVERLSEDERTFAIGHHMYDLGHDRPVLHFLKRANYRATYARQVARTVKPGGHVIGATFGPDGPTRCSHLEVVRYDPEALHNKFGKALHLVKHRTELH